MKLLIILALCGTVSLMPMENKTVQNEPTYCEPQTPCAWTPYRTQGPSEDITIINKYCTCPTDLICQVTKNDLQVNSYIHHCRPSDFESDVDFR